MDKMIKIIATPPGQAPEWVRKEWVGLVMPLSMVQPGKNDILTGAVDRQPEMANFMGYSVDGYVAVELLNEKNPKAAQWWKDNAPHALENMLVFNKEVCEVV